MSVGSMLSDLLCEASESKNYIIKETGIDRSTFYQILRGNRIATEEQLLAISRYIHADKATYEKLIDCYEKERSDEKLYEQRQEVKRFFNSLSEEQKVASDPQTEKKIAEFVEEEAAAGNDCYRIFLPSGSAKTTELFRAVERHFEVSGKEPEIRQLVAEEGERKTGRNGFFARLTEWFYYLRNQTTRFHAYSLGKKMTGLNTVAFPYYIVGERSMILISYSEKKVAVVRDQGMVDAYRENFDRILKDAAEIASTETDYMSIMQFFVDHWQTIGDEPVYLLTPRPCVWLCSNDELVAKYLKNEQFIQYGRMYRQLNIQEFTTRSGMDRFIEEARVHEAGIDLPVRPEDMKLVKDLLKEHRDKITFILNENRIRVPQEWQMFLIGHKVAAFVPYAKTNYMICFTNKSVVNPLADWFESRVKTMNNDIVRGGRIRID